MDSLPGTIDSKRSSRARRVRDWFSEARSRLYILLYNNAEVALSKPTPI